MFEEFKVDEQTEQQRLKICEECEFNKLHICTQCGCIIKLKVQWKRFSCPINKWMDVE